MPLQSADKSKIIYFLGYPAKTLDVNSTSWNSGVNSRLTGLDTYAEVRALALVAKIEAVELKIDSAQGRLAALKVEDIEINPEETNLLKKERRRLIRDLGAFLDIEPLYSSGGSMVNVCI